MKKVTLIITIGTFVILALAFFAITGVALTYIKDENGGFFAFACSITLCALFAYVGSIATIIHNENKNHKVVNAVGYCPFCNSYESFDVEIVEYEASVRGVKFPCTKHKCVCKKCHEEIFVADFANADLDKAFAEYERITGKKIKGDGK